MPAEIAEKCLNHVPKGLIAVYDRHNYRVEALTALRRWQGKLAVIVGEALAGDEVAPLASRSAA